jgi:hypothetical protein
LFTLLSSALVDFINNVHDGRILAFAVRDEASFSLTVRAGGGVSREGSGCDG